MARRRPEPPDPHLPGDDIDPSGAFSLRESDAQSLIGAFFLDSGERLLASVHLAGLVDGAPIKVAAAAPRPPMESAREAAAKVADLVAEATREAAMATGTGAHRSRLLFGRGGYLWAGSPAARLYRALLSSVDRTVVWPQLVVTDRRVLLIGLPGPGPGAAPGRIIEASIGGNRIQAAVLWSVARTAVGAGPRRWVRRRRLRLVFADGSWLEVLPYRFRRLDAAGVRTALGVAGS